MNNLDTLYDILRKDPELVNKEGELLKNAVYEKAMKMDAGLLRLLYSEKFTREMFFTDVDGIAVFDKVKFGWLLDSKDFLPDSYTMFRNQIMLTDGNRNSIRGNNEVVLSFPYKDCLLEMDSTKETESRREVFYNEVLMKSEIDTLLEPKCLANVRKISEKGEEEVSEFGDQDNLIIKGNNLLAMYSLLPRYREGIKCMYWDILYNREKDYVPYNDSFKHSSWLTMMKNRLTIARELLKPEGAIFLQCDDTEMAYLKVLCDEIFRRENYVNTISVTMKNAAGASGGGEDKRFKKNIEYILIYAKDYDSLEPFSSVFDYVEMGDLIQAYKEENRSWKYTTVLVDAGKGEYVGSTVDGDGNEIQVFRRIGPVYKSVSRIAKEGGIAEEEVYAKYGRQVFRTTNSQSSIRTRIMEYRKEKGIEEELLSIQYVPKTGQHKGQVYEQFYKGAPCNLLVWLKDSSEEIDGKLYKKVIQGTLWDFAGETKNLTKEGKVKLENGKKPEKLVGKILGCCMKKGDIVLDAYLGSGTTAAAAHKKGLQYIGLEQLDRHIELTKTRLRNVIAGDPSGISAEEGWKGGGSYIYCELADNSQKLITKIQNCEEPELQSVYTELQESEFISYQADVDALKDHAHEFEKLGEGDKRKFLISIIDKNTLYINYEDMKDAGYGIDEKTKAFNDSFYRRGEG